MTAKKTDTTDTVSPESVSPELVKLDAETTEKGYFGEVPDKTPNFNYTLAGVTSGAPTPETTRTE